MAEPVICESCGHRHSGQRWAYICIGCPCPETPMAVESSSTVAEMGGAFEGGPDSVEWLREQRAASSESEASDG